MLMEQRRPREIISIPSSESESSSAAGTPVRGQHSWRAPIPSLSGSLNVSESTDFELRGLTINSLSCSTIIEEDTNIQKIASNLGSMGMQPLYSLVENEEERPTNTGKDEISALDSFPFDSSKMMSTSSRLGSERLDDNPMDISDKSFQFNSGKIPIGHSAFNGSASNQLIQQSFRSPYVSGRSNIPVGPGNFPKAFGSEKDGEGTSSIRSDAERKLFQEFEINNTDSIRSKDGLMFTSDKSDQYDRVFSSSRSELDVSAEKRLLHTFLPGHMVNGTPASAINPDSVKSVETIDPFGMDVSAKSFNDSYRSDMSTDSVTRRQLLDFLEKTESGKSLDDSAKRMLMDYFDQTESAKSTDSVSRKELFDHFENSEHMRKMDTHTRNRFFEGFAEFNVGYPYFNISKAAQPQTSSFSLGGLFQQQSPPQQQHPQIFDSNYHQQPFQKNQEYHNSILSGIWMSKQNHQQQHDEIPLHQDGTFSEKYRSSVVDDTSATAEQPHRRTSFSGVMPQLWHKKPHKSPIVTPSQPEIAKEFPPLQQQHIQQQQSLLYSNGIVPPMSYSLQPQHQPQPQPVGNMYSLGPQSSGTMLTSTSLPALSSAPMSIQETPTVFNFPYATLNSNSGVARLPPIMNPAVNGPTSMSLQQLQQAQQYALLQQSSPSPRLLPPLTSSNQANGHSFYSANGLNGVPYVAGSTSTTAPTVTTTVNTADGQCIEILKPVLKEKQSASNATVGSSSSASVAARGAYRCGRCGQRKVDHVCKFVDKTYKSRGAQVYHPIYNLATNTPFPGEKFLTIRPRTTIHDTPAPADTIPSNYVGMASPQGVAASASVTTASLTEHDIQAILLRAKLHADSMAKQEMHDEEHFMKSSVSISVHQSMKHPGKSFAHIDLAKDGLDEEDDGEEQGEFRNNDALEEIEAEYRGHEAMDQEHDFLPEPAFSFGSQLSFRFLGSKAAASSTSEKKRTYATDHTGKFTPNTSVKFSKSNSFFVSPANATRYAANVIQRYWRGYRVRKQYSKRRKGLEKSNSFFVSPADATRFAANIIQRYWRGYRVRKHMSEEATT